MHPQYRAPLVLALVLSAMASSLGLASAEEVDSFAHLTYRLVGPAAGGRTTRVTGIAGDPRTYYVATASGWLGR